MCGITAGQKLRFPGEGLKSEGESAGNPRKKLDEQELGVGGTAPPHRPAGRWDKCDICPDGLLGGRDTARQAVVENTPTACWAVAPIDSNKVAIPFSEAHSKSELLLYCYRLDRVQFNQL